MYRTLFASPLCPIYSASVLQAKNTDDPITPLGTSPLSPTGASTPVTQHGEDDETPVRPKRPLHQAPCQLVVALLSGSLVIGTLFQDKTC
jgi:hypothetical protein